MRVAGDGSSHHHEETQPAEGGAGGPGDGAGAAGCPGLPGESDLDRPEPARGRQHHPAAADARYVMCHMSCVGMSCVICHVSVCHVSYVMCRYVICPGISHRSVCRLSVQSYRGAHRIFSRGGHKFSVFIASHVVFLSAPLLKIDAITIYL